MYSVALCTLLGLAGPLSNGDDIRVDSGPASSGPGHMRQFIYIAQ